MSNAMLLYAYMSDNELIDMIKSGNNACFEVLIRRHSQSLYRVGRMHSISHNDVDELLRCTHLTAFRRLKRFDGKFSYRILLLKSMLQSCLDKVDMINEGGAADCAEPAARSVDDTFTANRLDIHAPAVNQLQKELECLSFPLRSAYILSEIEGLSIKEVAGLLHVPESTAKNRLNKARIAINKTSNNMYFHTEVYNYNRNSCDVLVDVVMANIDAKSYNVERSLLPKY